MFDRINVQQISKLKVIGKKFSKWIDFAHKVTTSEIWLLQV